MGGKLRHAGVAGCRVLGAHTPPPPFTHRAGKESLNPFYRWEQPGTELVTPAAPQPCPVTPRHPVPPAGRGSPQPLGEQSPTQGAGPKQHPDAGPKHLDEGPKPPCGCRTPKYQIQDPKASLGCRTPNHHPDARPQSVAQALGSLGASRGVSVGCGGGLGAALWEVTFPPVQVGDGWAKSHVEGVK